MIIMTTTYEWCEISSLILENNFSANIKTVRNVQTASWHIYTTILLELLLINFYKHENRIEVHVGDFGKDDLR